MERENNMNKLTIRNTGEYLTIENPTQESEKYFCQRFEEAFLQAMRDEIALAIATFHKMKVGQKKVFLSKPIRIEFER